ncbi:MAG: sodium:proton antiporter [Candidatus Gastranaerophilales bacterium]|nr:sodium:proton antiporter [Candidatus Gastranaerophilales bacterium]
MEFNPVVISVIVLCILCLFKINVLFSLMISSIIAGLLAKMPISKIMELFISGMGQNSETALSYILLGALAAAMTHTGLTKVLSIKIAEFIKGNKYLLISILILISVMSQNLIPVHIAFIPILIPPLLSLMNKLKIDRRAIACSLAFGLKAPYISLPLGFGLIFQGLIADNMTQNGLMVSKTEIWHYSWTLGFAMLIALLFAIFVSYRKPREYETKDEVVSNFQEEKFNKKHYITLLGAIITLVVQLISGSLPLGALIGLCVIFGFRAVSHKKMDFLMNEGVGLMGYIAFVMLVCAGYALVLKETGGIESLVNFILPYIENSKILASCAILAIGLLITIGIGSSFGTIPILAVLFVPLCLKLGFSTPAIIILLCAAAALGDAGSPASDTTLGPTAGLGADGQHNHIKDTCIPTFLHFNTALIVMALIAVYIFK